MNLLKSVMRNEGLLLLRNKFLAIPFLINILCWGYGIVSYEIQSSHYEERAAAFYQSFIWMLPLNLLIVGLIAVYMASKDRDNEFEQLAVTYDVKNVDWVVGKWLITQLYGLCITVMTVVVQAIWLMSAAMTIGDRFKNAFYVFIQMEGALFLLISIGFFFAIWIKSMLAYLVIPAILTMSLFLPFDYTGVGYIWDPPMLHLLTPFDYMFIGSPHQGIWGIEHVYDHSILHQGAVVLVGLVLIVAALLLFQRHRRSRKEKKLLPIFIIILIIPAFLLGGMRYTQYNQALRQFMTTGQQYAESFQGGDEAEYGEWSNSFYDHDKDDRAYEFAMEKTNLSVELRMDDQIRVQSTLTIKNNGNEPVDDVFLTLYHGLSLEECTSERSLTCSRDKDFITLHVDQAVQPGETFDVSLHYEGNILQFRDDGYIEQAFVKKERIYLPKEAGWYPLIGKRPLAIAREHNNLYAQFELRNARLVEDFPTEFAVKIKREKQNLPLALTIPEVSQGMFQGTSQYGLSLIGGNFEENKLGQLRVIAHPEVFNGMKEVIEHYQKSWSFIEEWLEVPMSPSVIYILDDNYYYLTSNSVNHDFFVMRSAYIDDLDIAYKLTNELMLTGHFNHSEDYSVLYNAMAWMVMNHLHEQVDFVEWYKTDRWLEDKELTLVRLLQDYEEKGMEPFEDVLKYLFHYWTGLDNKQDFDMEAALKQYEGESS